MTEILIGFANVTLMFSLWGLGLIALFIIARVIVRGWPR